MKTIALDDKNYPKILKRINNPPKVLYVMGDDSILNDFALGIVGTRKASIYGKNITKSLAYGLAKKGVTIISGMAIGIDKEAHTGALLAKGKTIAVLGSGFNNIYPKENEKLFWEIVNAGGAVVTEYEKSIMAEPKNFPARNRIISGMSQGIIVTEASERSGSFITVDLALEEGKEIFAVPR